MVLSFVKCGELENLLNIMRREFGSTVVDELTRGRPVKGVIAWRIFDFLLKFGGLVYEDEEINERECYVAIINVRNAALYAIVKSGEITRAYLIRPVDRVVIEKIIEEYKRCVSMNV